MTLSSLSPEAQLLLSVVGPAGADLQIRQLLAGPMDWQRLSMLAVHAKAFPALWTRLERTGTDAIPEAARSHLRRLSMVAEFRHAHLEQRFLQLLELLGAHGIHAMPLKGAALAVSAYGGFRDRSMADLDLLVRHDQAIEAQELLLRSGWQAAYPTSEEAGDWRREFYAGHHHLPPLVDAHGPGLAVEIHTALFPPGHPFELPTEAIWQNARAVTFHQRSVQVPSPVHQLLHLCLHFAWSHMMRFGAWRAFQDLAALVGNGGVNWAEFTRLARESGSVSYCYWTLRLARNLASVPVPDEVLAQLQPRLPRLVLRRLEYHLAHEMLPSEAICPSVWLRQAMWEIAVRPDHGGQRSMRPWQHSGHAPLRTNAGDRGGQRVWKHLQQLGHWKGYLSAMLSPGAGAKPRTNGV